MSEIKFCKNGGKGAGKELLGASERAHRLGPPELRKCLTVTTSHIERQNLTMRMGIRCFTRLTNGSSKKAENLAAAVSLHSIHYNVAPPHKSRATPYPRTPAMARGVTDHRWSVEEIVGLLG